MFNPPLSDTHKTHFQSHDSGTHSHHCRSPATSSIYRVPDLVIHRWSATQSLSWARQNDNVCLWKPEKVRGSNPLKNRTPFCTVLVSKRVAKRAPSPSWKILVIGNHHQLFKVENRYLIYPLSATLPNCYAQYATENLGPFRDPMGGNIPKNLVVWSCSKSPEWDICHPLFTYANRIRKCTSKISKFQSQPLLQVIIQTSCHIQPLLRILDDLHPDA